MELSFGQSKSRSGAWEADTSHVRTQGCNEQHLSHFCDTDILTYSQYFVNMRILALKQCAVSKCCQSIIDKCCRWMCSDLRRESLNTTRIMMQHFKASLISPSSEDKILTVVYLPQRSSLEHMPPVWRWTPMKEMQIRDNLQSWDSSLSGWVYVRELTYPVMKPFTSISRFPRALGGYLKSEGTAEPDYIK